MVESVIIVVALTAFMSAVCLCIIIGIVDWAWDSLR